MTFDDKTDKTTFESTGRKVYSYGEFHSVWIDSCGDCQAAYGSDGGQEVSVDEALEIVDDSLKHFQELRQKLIEMKGD